MNKACSEQSTTPWGPGPPAVGPEGGACTVRAAAASVGLEGGDRLGGDVNWEEEKRKNRRQSLNILNKSNESRI